jgi:hypothetical protein
VTAADHLGRPRSEEGFEVEEVAEQIEMGIDAKKGFA